MNQDDQNMNNDGRNQTLAAMFAALATAETRLQPEEDGRSLAEEERIKAAVANQRRRRRSKLMSILTRNEEFPLRQQNKLDELIEDLLRNLKDDIHSMICDRNFDAYRGLNSDRDTVDEVQTAVQFFPEVLSERYQGGLFPIQRIPFMVSTSTSTHRWRCNLKTISFIHVLARLALEFGSFEDQERGGLLVENGQGSHNPLQSLMASSSSSFGEEHNRRVDNAILRELIQLREMDLFRKEDVRRYKLVMFICCDEDQHVFAENRFRYLVGWDPTSLTQVSGNGYLPLHAAAQRGGTVHRFKTVFECTIRYYPIKKGIGLLFTKSPGGRTPFQLACEKLKYKPVMEAVEDVLNNSDVQISTIEAIFLAAINNDITLDCVYLLMRREPHVVINRFNHQICR